MMRSYSWFCWPSRPLLAALLCLGLLASWPCHSQQSLEISARSRSSSSGSGSAPDGEILAVSTRVTASGEVDASVTVAEAGSSPWYKVLRELQGPYALVYDEPDNSLWLDRSEISEGLIHVHPVDMMSASADALFSQGVDTDTSLHALVRNAAEIHVAPAGDWGRKVARLFSAVPASPRRVLHQYAAHGQGVCARDGEDGATSCAAEEKGSLWHSWEVLDLPRGLLHLDVSIDEPLSDDLIRASDAANPLHRLVVSFRAFQALPQGVLLLLSIDGAELLSGPLVPVPSAVREAGDAGASGESNGAATSADSEHCGLEFDGNEIEHLEGRCSLAIMLQPLPLGKHVATVLLESRATGKNATASAVFTVVGGVLQERQGPAARHVTHARTPVQRGKGHWVWQALEVPRLGDEAARVEADFKRHKRNVLHDLLVESGISPYPSRGRGGSRSRDGEKAGEGGEGAGGGNGGVEGEEKQVEEGHGGGLISAQPAGITVAELMYNAEAAAHTAQEPSVVFPLPNSTIEVLDKVPITLGVRVALGWPLLSPKVAKIAINIVMEMDVPDREPNITYLGEEQVQQRSLSGKPSLAFGEGEIQHRFDDGSEAPHFMTVEYAAADESVSIPGSITIDLNVTQGSQVHLVHATSFIKSRDPSTAMHARRRRQGTVALENGGEDGETRRFEAAAGSWVRPVDGVYAVSIRRQESEFQRLAEMLRSIGAAAAGSEGGISGGGYSLEPERWEAFDASEQIAHEFALLRVSERLLGTGSGWNVGAFGCAESHFRLLLHVAERGEARGLVLEHDSLLARGLTARDAARVLEGAMANVPEDAELLFVGYCYPRLRERVNEWWVSGGACCTHGYVISWEGALRLLNALDPLTAPIDEIMRELCFTGQLACYILRPEIEVDPALPALEYGLFVQDWQEK